MFEKKRLRRLVVDITKQLNATTAENITYGLKLQAIRQTVYKAQIGQLKIKDCEYRLNLVNVNLHNIAILAEERKPSARGGMVDTSDLKSVGNSRAGSSPAARTSLNKE